MNDALTRTSYTTFLTRMLAWLQPTERALSHRLPSRDLQVALVERAGWLAEDLVALGAPLPDSAPAEVLPALDSPGHAIGCWYVVEGSALGGQVISRRVQSRLGVTRDTGGRYFAGNGAATAARWRDVCGALDRYDGTTGDVIEGARRSFESLGAWLI
jgi:heme oxygenase